MSASPEPLSPSPEAPRLSYFVATLADAQRINAASPPHGISTISQLLDERAASTPHLPAVGMAIPSAEGTSAWQPVVYTFKDLRDISTALAHCLVDSQTIPAVPCTAEPPPTAGILASSSVQFLMTFLALVRIGYSVLLIGPQSTPNAISRLLTATACTHLFHSSPLAGPLPASCTAVSLLPFPPSSSSPTLPYPTPPTITASTTAYIHHTSGTSSGVPTAIPHPHAAATSWLPQLAPATAFSTTPLSHGGTADLMRSLMASGMLWLYPPSAPFTAQNILRALEAADAAALPPTLFTAVPYMLELCAADSPVMRRLAAMAMVGVGGAPLRTEVGTDLTQRGVKLVSRFGSSECGFLMSSHRDFDTDKAWDYLRVPPDCTQLQFTALSPGSTMLELTVLPGWPQITRPNRADGAYVTGDLFTAHATLPGAYRYAGRRDGMLVLSSGRKLDAAAIEADIVARGVARDAVVFGRDRPFAGVLLFGAREDPHVGGIMAEMVVVMPVGMEAPRNSKGVVMRGAVDEVFAEVISGAYRRVEGGEGGGGGDRSGGGGAEGEWVGEAVRDVVGLLDDDADLFSAGVDSVMAAQIRGRLIKGLPAGTTLPRNAVFEQRTIRGLREFIAAGGDVDGGLLPPQTDLMNRLVEKYSDFSVPADDPGTSDGGDGGGHVVVLTGATGTLGAHVLYQLCRRPGIKKVVCLCRANDDAHARTRVAESLRARKLPASAACVTAYAAVLGEHDLGLGAAVYAELETEVSVIVHVAWAVNFVASLASFEKDHIAGTRNLADLALSSTRRARLCFCSTTAAVLGTGARIQEQFTQDPGTAAPLGYARSKWVAEQICQRLPGRAAVVVRIGQLCADTAGGVWNETEAWPLMFASVNAVRCLPELGEKLSWLPVDMAAEAVLDIALHNHHPHDGPRVFHVVNTDTSTSWGSVLDWIQQRAGASFERVPPSEWVNRLAATDESPANPSWKLLGLWEASYGEGARGGIQTDYCFEVGNTLALSKGLGWKIEREYVQNIWDSWVQSGFIRE